MLLARIPECDMHQGACSLFSSHVAYGWPFVPSDECISVPGLGFPLVGGNYYEHDTITS